MDAAGNIFGTSYRTVFELSPNGSDGWASTVIHTFAVTKGALEGTLVLDKSGNLYGTAYDGGKYGVGTVYKLTNVLTGKKKGTWTEKLLYSFEGGIEDGRDIYALRKSMANTTMELFTS